MAQSFPAFILMAGETLDLHVCSSIDARDAVALVYFCGGDEKACVVQPCSLALSQYQMHIGPLGRAACVEVPYMSIATWGIARASAAVVKCFTRVQQQAEEEAARVGAGASAGPCAVAPLLSAAAAAASPHTTRQRYADPQPALYVVTLQSKHVWQHRLVVQSERLLKNIQAHLVMTHCIARISDLPAFSVAEELRKETEKKQQKQQKQQQQQQQQQHDVGTGADANSLAAMWTSDFGWNVYSAQRDFARQLCIDPSLPAMEVATEAAVHAGRIGVQKDLRPWFSLVDLREEGRDTHRGGRMADHLYTSSPTYPDVFLLPKHVDRELLLRAMAARSRARVPAVSYVCLRTGAVLARSSQPLMWSPHLGADSDVCHALVNTGYAPHHALPRCAASPLATTTAATTAPRGAAAVGDARPVRPPSLFDDDDDGAGGDEQPVHAARDAIAGSDRATTPPAGATQMSSDATAAAEAGATARVLLVADCRPQMTASGNAQLGGGYESGSCYTFCQTSFFDIDNIFGVTKAFEKLRGMVARYQGNTAETTFLRRLYDSDWLAIIQRVLACAVAAAQSLQGGVSCLVHCTDGWDRTSQCTALTMLLLDPHYRTIVGFCTLVEKEFCSFGHKFAERAGHQLPGRTTVSTHSGVASSDTEQHNGSGAPRLDTSPIFLHFVDAVYQVWRQYPTCFEFTPALLAHLSDVVYSCLYGTFVCNGEQERRLEGVRLRTVSVWTDVLRRTQREKRGEVALCFVNERYDAATAWRFIAQRRGCSSSSSSCSGGGGAPAAAAALHDFVLLPNVSSKRLVFWEQLYTREDADHYLTFNPNVREPTTTRVVSWGPQFDRYLEAEIESACDERARELPSLVALEDVMGGEAATRAAAAAATSATAKSAWCVYDAVNCFHCFKPFGMWSTKTQCVVCRQYFCSDCNVHDCMAQQY